MDHAEPRKMSDSSPCSSRRQHGAGNPPFCLPAHARSHNVAIDLFPAYDVILICTHVPSATVIAWLNDFGESVVACGIDQPDRFFRGSSSIHNVTQYAAGLKIDFTLWPSRLFQQIVAASALPACRSSAGACAARQRPPDR
jgi:hypothetical protein